MTEKIQLIKIRRKLNKFLCLKNCYNSLILRLSYERVLTNYQKKEKLKF
jgi:hypothetical protein